MRQLARPGGTVARDACGAFVLRHGPAITARVARHPGRGTSDRPDRRPAGQRDHRRSTARRRPRPGCHRPPSQGGHGAEAPHGRLPARRSAPDPDGAGPRGGPRLRTGCGCQPPLSRLPQGHLGRAHDLRPRRHRVRPRNRTGRSGSSLPRDRHRRRPRRDANPTAGALTATGSRSRATASGTRSCWRPVSASSESPTGNSKASRSQ